MKKDCTNCGYAEWQKTPSGRRLLESPGKCKFPVPALPHCFLSYDGRMPQPNWVNKWTKPDCPCWKKK